MTRFSRRARSAGLAASPGGRAEQAEPAWGGERDPHPLLAVGEPRRVDARASIEVTQLVHENRHQLHLVGPVTTGLATGYYQVSGTERDARAGTRATVAERHDGDLPLRRHLAQRQQEPRIDLATLELMADGRRLRDLRIQLHKRGPGCSAVRDLLAQRGGVRGGSPREDQPDGNPPRSRAEARDGRRRVSG